MTVTYGVSEGGRKEKYVPLIRVPGRRDTRYNRFGQNNRVLLVPCRKPLSERPYGG
jgi:hypothetical protein